MQPWTKKKSLQTAQRCRCKLLSGWKCCSTRFAHRLCWFCNIGNFQLKSCCCLSLGVASNYFGYEDFQPHLFLIVAGSKFFSVFSLSKQGQPLRRAICACKSWPPKKTPKKYGTVASTKGQKADSPDLLLHGLSVSFWTHCGNYIVATSGHWWGAFQIWQGVHVRNSHCRLLARLGGSGWKGSKKARFFDCDTQTANRDCAQIAELALSPTSIALWTSLPSLMWLQNLISFLWWFCPEINMINAARHLRECTAYTFQIPYLILFG